MSIRRVVTDISSERLDESREFYVGVLGFQLVMDRGFVMTFASPSNPTAQITIMRSGGSSGPVPEVT
jgi:catechol 2,3-dioxygenase-like lactoylglutathione lyase family enzyme